MATSPVSADGSVASFGGHRFDVASGRLWRGDEEVWLRPKTAAVLGCLVARPGAVVSKAELLATVWPDGFIGDEVLTGCIKELRQVLADDPREPKFIATVHRRGYRFVAPVATGPERESAWRSSPFVGREAELERLEGWWRQALSADRQVVFVAAQPGVGKTAVVDAFVERLRAGGDVSVGRGQCVEQFGGGEPYLPVLDALAELCRSPDGVRVREVLGRVAPAWLLQLPGFVDAAEAERLRLRTAGASSSRMLRELGDAAEALAAVRPLLLVLEDLHDSDRATTELLAYLAQRPEPSRIMVLGTYRPAQVVATRHPLQQVVSEVRARRRGVLLPLELLTREAVAAYLAARLAPRCPSPALVADVHERTEGNALFMATVVDFLVDGDLLVDVDGETGTGVPFDQLGVPESIAAFIERQVDELADADRQLLEAASAVGVEFTAAAVLAAAGGDDSGLSDVEVEDRCLALARASAWLEQRGVIGWPDGTITAEFSFRHALFPEVLYNRMSPTRRVQAHRRIGERLAAGHGASSAELAAELAMHFERGRALDQAVRFLIPAAETALGRYAHREVIGYVQRGLALLEHLPDIPDRPIVEFQLRRLQIAAVRVIHGDGSPEVEAATGHAHALCAEVDDPSLVGPVLHGLWRLRHFHGRVAEASALTDRMEELARRHGDEVVELEADHMAGYDHYVAGRYEAAVERWDRCLERYDPVAHRHLGLTFSEDPGVMTHMFAAFATWALGYPERARHHADEGRRIAAGLGIPSTMIQATLCAVQANLQRRDVARVRELTDALVAMIEEFEIYERLLNDCRLFDGWAKAELVGPAEAIPQLLEAVAESRGSNPFLDSLAAERIAEAGDLDAALDITEQALDTARRSDYHLVLPRLLRLRGELLLKRPDREEDAEHDLVEALALAREQRAKSDELRAATSLARLWQRRGDRAAARDVLADLYASFTEGHDTPDLQEAAAVLATLA